MTWETTIAQAARVSAAASAHEPALRKLLDHALAGTLTLTEVRAVLGPSAAPLSGFTDSVDSALRGGYRDEPALSAARAVLYELPNLLHRIAISAEHDMMEPVQHESRDALARLENQRARVGALVAGIEGPHQCPRCGARQVSEQYTSALGPRLIEVMCRACGEYGSWMEGDSAETMWAT